MFESISSDAANDLLTKVFNFREREPGQSTTQEAATLLSLFPGVRVREGYVLDFSQEKTSTGVNLPIRPFARPEEDDSWLLLLDDEMGREELVDQFYQYLEYDQTVQALFEYTLFVLEMWTLRLSRHAADWHESAPIFDEAAFDRVLETSDKVSDLTRPGHFGPMAGFNADNGGQVRFLVHTSMGWERIYFLESVIFSDGFVEQEAGEIVADLGLGLIF